MPVARISALQQAISRRPQPWAIPHSVKCAKCNRLPVEVMLHCVGRYLPTKYSVRRTFTYCMLACCLVGSNLYCSVRMAANLLRQKERSNLIYGATNTKLRQHRNKQPAPLCPLMMSFITSAHSLWGKEPRLTRQPLVRFLVCFLVVLHPKGLQLLQLCALPYTVHITECMHITILRLLYQAPPHPLLQFGQNTYF